MVPTMDIDIQRTAVVRGSRLYWIGLSTNERHGFTSTLPNMPSIANALRGPARRLHALPATVPPAAASDLSSFRFDADHPLVVACSKWFLSLFHQPKIWMITLVSKNKHVVCRSRVVEHMIVHFLRMLCQRRKFLSEEPSGSVIVMPDADAVASSLCKQAGSTRPEDWPPPHADPRWSKILSNICATTQRRG